MDLSGLWRLQGFEAGRAPAEASKPTLDDRFWITANVPGDVHSALVERGLITDPYFGHQDQNSRWIEDREWWYRTQFDYILEPDRGERHELVFEGLDTFATIYVNGLEVGKTDNMLLAHTFDVTKVLRSGWNAISVKFDPLRLHHADKELFQWSSYTKERPWLRKAAMNFGWDWGPRMVTVGICGKVRIERSRIAKLDSVFGRTVRLDNVLHAEGAREQAEADSIRGTGGNTDSLAVIRVDADVVLHRRGGWNQAEVPQAEISCEFRLLDADGLLVASARAGAEALKGAGIRQARSSAELSVRNPQLWWTHDHGEPYLYTLEVILTADGEEVERYQQPFGIRTIELQTKDRQGNNSFAFVLNGVRIYAKGCNWIPADHLIGSIPDERYEDLIALTVSGSMNMLRVWAGGIYEKDVFYRECDRRGVLVWQDFAFANALFPDFNKNFMDNVRKEVVYNIKRLRNHASLALWCGNNEIDWLIDMKTSGGDLNCPFYGESIYHELIPDMLGELDDSRAYWPSSPYGGNDANDPDEGDRHNWQVWHGSVYPRKFGDAPRLDYSIQGVTFQNYKKDFALFSSEFGMHASANRYTLEKYIPEGEFYWNSAEMAYRNKDTNHRKGILLMEGFTGIPQDIEEYMNFSMLTQAEGLKYGIEHYRRIKQRNSGALVWQLNDAWPGTSWSMIDYELLPKASYYYGKRFFHPLLICIDHEPGEALKLWAVNDTRQPLQGQVSITVTDFSGLELYSGVFAAEVPANEALQIGSLEESAVLNGGAAEQAVVRLSAAGFGAPENTYYLRTPRELQLPAASFDVKLDEAEGTVTVAAHGQLLRMVKLDLPLGNIRFSDNYFDLLPGESKAIRITDRSGQPVALTGIKVSALNNGNQVQG